MQDLNVKFIAKMKHKLLIIDDDTDLTVLLAWHLSRDYDVIVASECLRGHEVSLFRKHRPHLILLELDLQGTSGVEILRDILHCDAKAIVIIVSSNPSLQLARDTIKMGARDYVSKPFAFADLKATIKKHLDKVPLGTSRRLSPRRSLRD